MRRRIAGPEMCDATGADVSTGGCYIKFFIVFVPL